MQYRDFPVNIAKFLRAPILKNSEWLLFKFKNESVFWSLSIILNLFWKTYFMCILLSDCTTSVVIRLKIKEPNLDYRFCKWSSVSKIWEPRCEKKKTSWRSCACELEEERRMLEINCSMWTCKAVSNKLLWFSWRIYMVVE